MNNLENDKENIIITGMPGGGKTTIGKELAKQIGYNFIDFDDDILEKIKIQTADEIIDILGIRSHNITPENLSYKEVKDLLERLGEEDFLELEGIIGKSLIFNEATVLSTSGSLPLKIDAMEHLKKDGKVIYIDTDIKSILKRLGQMKTDRIIGMGRMTLEEILNYRKDFYDISKDYNFEVPKFDLKLKNTRAERFRQKVIIFDEFMKFYKENNIGK